MLLGLTVLLALSGGCRTGRLKYDGAALKTIQRVAVIMYTVPVKVGFSEKPGRQKGKRLLLRMTDSETADNGMLAATQAQASFIEEFNLSDLEFKAISQSEMFGNQEFMQLAGEVLKEQQERLAEARAEDEKTTTGQTKQMLEVFSRASGQRQETAGVG
ncbi:MAG: hypothetical protein OEZ59_12095, partial [Deltaproteobacteria bacterium]|nr:hypothetical protein [Deltaproteobacteria bacterium]